MNGNSMLVHLEKHSERLQREFLESIGCGKIDAVEEGFFDREDFYKFVEGDIND